MQTEPDVGPHRAEARGSPQYKSTETDCGLKTDCEQFTVGLGLTRGRGRGLMLFDLKSRLHLGANGEKACLSWRTK